MRRQYSPLTNRIIGTSRAGKSPRRGNAIMHVIVHATAGGTVQGNLDRFKDGQIVTCNYFVGDGKIYGIVPEPERAHTSGSRYDGGKGAQWDRQSITIECLNYQEAGVWKVRPADYAALTALIAEIAKAYEIPIATTHIIGHRELWTRYGASYPTACPAGIDMPKLVTDINRLTKDDEMTPEQAKQLADTAARVRNIDYMLVKNIAPAVGRIDTLRWKLNERDVPALHKSIADLRTEVAAIKATLNHYTKNDK